MATSWRKRNQRPRPKPKPAEIPFFRGIPKSVEFPNTPNYQSLIEADPSYMSWKTGAQAQIGTAASQRKSALQRLLNQFGGVSGYDDPYGDISGEDQALAQSNPFSALSQLGRDFSQGTNAMRRSLAARGGVRSGELGHGQEQLQQARAQGEYDIGQTFIDALSEAIGQFQQTESGVYAGESDVLRDISGKIAAAHPPTQGKAMLDRDLSLKLQRHIYKDASGQFWVVGASGPEKFTPPPPAPAAPAPAPVEPGFNIPTPQPGQPGYVPPGLEQFIPGSPPPVK